MEPASPSPRPSPALAFGAVGVAAAWAIADFFRLSYLSGETPLRVLVLAGVPLGAAAFGHVLGRWLHWPSWQGLVAVVATTLGAGALLGAAIGAVSEALFGDAVHGASSGTAAAALALPAVVAVFFAHRSVGRARAGSIVDALDRRGVMVAVAASVTLGAVVAGPEWFFHAARPQRLWPEGPLVFAVLAIAAIAVCAASDLGASRHLERLERDVAEMSPRDLHAIDPPRTFVDVGVGETLVEEVIRPLAPYRETAEVTRVVRGDATFARRAARHALVRDACALAFGAAAVVYAHPSPPSRTTPAIEVAGAGGASNDSVGVAACDEFLDVAEKCTPKLPERGRKAMTEALEQSKTSWKQADKSPAAQAALADACRYAMEALQQNPACR